MQDRLKKQIEFMLELDKMKNLYRQTYVLHEDRKENDAEHSWHLAVLAMLMAEHSNKPVEVTRVMKMVLIHDVVEIDALETTKASSKKGNNYYNFYNPNELNTNDVYYTLKILEKAENESQKMKDDKKIKKKEESFIDKILKPFKCGD